MPHTDCSPASNIYSGSVSETWETSSASSAMSGPQGILLAIHLAMTRAAERAHQRFAMDCPKNCPLKMGLFSIRIGRVRTAVEGGAFKMKVTVSWRLLVKCTRDKGESHRAPSFIEWNELRNLIAASAPE